MFGWQVKKWDDPKMEYYMWNYPGENMGGGGIGQVNMEMSKQGPHVDIYIDVENIAHAIEKAKVLGATQLVPETKIGDGEMGYFAVIQIPGGVNLGLWSKVPSAKLQTEPSMSRKQ
jgi:predicted enzyme related to lactoylglutathione lyase